VVLVLALGLSRQTAGNCLSPLGSHSGYLILQDTWDSGSDPSHVAQRGSSATTVVCNVNNCGHEGATWDRYSIVWVTLPSGAKEMQRVKAFDTQTGTITLCGSFPTLVAMGMPYRIARQVPHFVDGHEVPGYLGTVYHDLFAGLK
jgi:hypothetical protein